MSSTLLDSALCLALVSCVLGLAWKISAWFRAAIGADAAAIALRKRILAPIHGFARACRQPQLLVELAAAARDAALQRRLYRRSRLRWMAHLAIVVGFVALLLLHALAPISLAPWMPDYLPTRNPQLFLRNLAGAMVLAGIALLAYARRRESQRGQEAASPRTSRIAWLLVLVVASGFLAEAHKISSPRVFLRMTEQYLGTSDPATLAPLRAYWQREFGLARGVDVPAAPARASGRRMHEEACASCHASTQWAWGSYVLARMLAPVADGLDRLHGDILLSNLHALAALIGLALLPFSRLLHAVADPISLVAARYANLVPLTAAGRATYRALAADACVRCGLCNGECSVRPLARWFGNALILPAEKLAAHVAPRRDRATRAATHAGLSALAQAAYTCTDCGRCTEACPVGIDLADMWMAGKQDLAAAGWQAPIACMGAHSALVWSDRLAHKLSPEAYAALLERHAPLAAQRANFARCVQCQICTNVCPVVEVSAQARCKIDLSPQQVMNLLRLGMSELALGSRMVRDCASCYMCQEYCPEGVRVADILIELRAIGAQQLAYADHEVAQA